MSASAPLRIVVLLLAAVVLAACGLVRDEPVEVSLAELVAAQEDHDGRMVATEGVVRSHDDPLHYWIEDDDPNRVELVPHEEVEPNLGEHVRVVGRFTFSLDGGRLIEVEEIEPLAETPRAVGSAPSDG